jgi:hypothetical protein
MILLPLIGDSGMGVIFCLFLSFYAISLFLHGDPLSGIFERIGSLSEFELYWIWAKCGRPKAGYMLLADPNEVRVRSEATKRSAH